jgi:hypothetical protein
MQLKTFNEFIFESLQSNTTKLESAIDNKFVCIIDYRGLDKGSIENGIRYIEPYVLGTNRLGNTVLRAWMIKGVSKTGKVDPSLVPGWRLYRVDRIFSLQQTLTAIKLPQKGYNIARDGKMSEIIASIKF